jgi:hypothetical protein
MHMRRIFLRGSMVADGVHGSVCFQLSVSHKAAHYCTLIRYSTLNYASLRRGLRCLLFLTCR